MSAFKPLLASPVDINNIDYDNTWISPKYDGIRAIIINGVVMSRSLKPIPNEYVQSLFGLSRLEGLDGELIVGEPNSASVYHDTYSGVMKKDGTPHARFYVFDHIGAPNDSYLKRHGTAYALSSRYEECVPVMQHAVVDHEALLELETHYLNLGYEGLMLRAVQGPNSMYKFGRATSKSGTLSKLKRFTDAEAVITGFQEQMFNGNEATKDELGRTKRSSHAENKTGKGTLGALICVDVDSGVTFNIGTGFDDATKQALWDQRDVMVGKLVKYKSFKIGVKDAPRFPVYLGLRSPIDM